MAEALSSIILWQGFRHAWDYNHRVNRFGSFIEHDTDEGGLKAHIAHACASGWGQDTANFTEFYTHVKQADGVWFQTAAKELTIDCTRMRRNHFLETITLSLDDELQDADTFAVVLNGFDLEAQRVADKLMDFELEVGRARKSGDKLTFTLRGHLQFDCRSTECVIDDINKRDALELGEEAADRPKNVFEVLAEWLGVDDEVEALQQGLQDQKEDLLEKLPGKVFDIQETEADRQAEEHLKVLKKRDRELHRQANWQHKSRKLAIRLNNLGVLGKVPPLTTPYRLKVYFVVVGGKSKKLNVVRDAFELRAQAGHPLREYQYQWGMDASIYPPTPQVDDPPGEGITPEPVSGVFTQIDDGFGCDIPALTRISMDVQMIQADAINQLKCAAMHFKDWHVAIRNPQRADGGVAVDVELFYRAWRQDMQETHGFDSSQSHNFAGSAQFSVDALLLQFDGDCAPGEESGQLQWGGITNKKLTDNEVRTTIDAV